MSVFLDTTIRRTVSIPKTVGNESILAIVEVGGKLLNKDVVYQMFFEHGAEKVKSALEKIYVERGGSKENFAKVIGEARKRVDGKEEVPVVATSKKEGKKKVSNKIPKLNS